MAEAHETNHREEIDPSKHLYPLMRIQFRMPQIILRITGDEIHKLLDQIDLIVALNDKITGCQTSIPEDVKKEYDRAAHDLSHYCGCLKSALFRTFSDEKRFSGEWSWVVVLFEYIVTLIHREISEKAKFYADAILQRILWIQHPEKRNEMFDELCRSKGIKV